MNYAAECDDERSASHGLATAIAPDDFARAEDPIGTDLDAENNGGPDVARKNRTAMQALLSVIDQAVVSATNFATTVIIGRYASKYDLGIYSLAFSVLLLARGIQYQVVSAPYMIYWGRRPRSERESYLGSSAIHQLVLTVLVLLGLGAHIAGLSVGWGPHDLIPVMWVMLGAVPFLLLREFIRCLCLAHLEMAQAILVDAIVAAVQLGLILLLVATHSVTVPYVYAVMGLACLIASLPWLTRGAREAKVVRADVISDWWANWAFGRWALMSHLVGGSIPYIMPWIVAVACGEAETGVLAAASTLVGLSNTFVMGLGNFLTPRAALAYSQGGVHGLSRMLWGFALVFVISLGTFCVAIAGCGDWLAVQLYGEHFRGSGLVITLLALTILANSLRMTAGGGLWAIERPRMNFLAELCTLVVTLGVSIACVGSLGVLGAALGMLSGAVAGLIAGTVILLRTLKTLREQSELA